MNLKVYHGDFQFQIFTAVEFNNYEVNARLKLGQRHLGTLSFLIKDVISRQTGICSLTLISEEGTGIGRVLHSSQIEDLWWLQIRRQPTENNTLNFVFPGGPYLLIDTI